MLTHTLRYKANESALDIKEKLTRQLKVIRDVTLLPNEENSRLSLLQEYLQTGNSTIVEQNMCKMATVSDGEESAKVVIILTGKVYFCEACIDLHVDVHCNVEEVNNNEQQLRSIEKDVSVCSGS